MLADAVNVTPEITLAPVMLPPLPMVRKLPLVTVPLMFAPDQTPELANTATLLDPPTEIVTSPLEVAIFTLLVPQFMLVPAVVIPVSPDPSPTKY